ncbi:MAG: hypothetical protein ACOX6V_02045 [Patescibacteria group bacterium]
MNSHYSNYAIRLLVEEGKEAQQVWYEEKLYIIAPQSTNFSVLAIIRGVTTNTYARFYVCGLCSTTGKTKSDDDLGEWLEPPVDATAICNWVTESKKAVPFCFGFDKITEVNVNKDDYGMIVVKFYSYSGDINWQNYLYKPIAPSANLLTLASIQTLTFMSEEEVGY